MMWDMRARREKKVGGKAREKILWRGVENRRKERGKVAVGCRNYYESKRRSPSSWHMRHRRKRQRGKTDSSSEMIEWEKVEHGKSR